MADPGAALLAFSRDLTAEVTAAHVVLAQAQVRGYTRTEHGHEEYVRPHMRYFQSRWGHVMETDLAGRAARFWNRTDRTWYPQDEAGDSVFQAQLPKSEVGWHEVTQPYFGSWVTGGTPLQRQQVHNAVEHQRKWLGKLADEPGFTITPDEEMEGHGGDTAGRDIRLNAKLSDPDMPAKLAESRRALKFVPAEDSFNPWDQVVAHETGHYAMHEAGAIPQEVFGKLAAALSSWHDKVSPPEPGHEAEWFGRDGVQQAIEAGVSLYAAEIPEGEAPGEEFWAELWAEYTLAAHPREPARIFGDWLTQTLKVRGRI